ncbi:MAG: tRNA (adenosine(37)-N6)-threonylcarbamoyltransferase complex ATPase subunit type 1 TsaE [Actinobacteria bacterium]|uniref:tRNA threonylcarbamoyladenosine biosynthesis protein TsaE n=1 Tax=freshwater metagenome TaxID=449393 RepID=A0A6J7CPT6_9ZZZZ|nr:tRNA (adenosine(37)-N6)-threonylcarbamoyltransferase complex ATPase subunit type 1 TsaE [Actinomycetota bacterium]
MEFPVDLKTTSPRETEAVGSELAECFVAGDRVILEGDLGSGKTVLVRGICRGLGIAADITSPTFTLAQRYEEGRLPVSHLDLYRLEPGMAGEDPGVLEGEFSTERVTLVEWPERAPLGALQPTYRVSLQHLGGDERQVLVECLS